MISSGIFSERWQRGALVGSFALALCLLPSETTATIPPSDLRGALAFVADRAEEGTFSGVVLAARNGAAPIVSSYGNADFELGTPVQSDSIFAIASVTKLVTAATVLRLVDDGKMSLDTSVCAFLANCPSAWRAVTIEELLNHSSGIPDLFEAVPAAPLDATLPAIDKTIAKTSPRELALLGLRREVVAYSNFNYLLLGYAIERETHMSWDAAVRSEVSGPLGMTSTQYDDPWAIVSRRVRGYTLDKDFKIRNVGYSDDSAYAAGGLLSDVTDLYRFTSGVLGESFLSKAMRLRMLTPNSGGFGLGWQVTRFWDEPVYDLSGGTTGFTSHIAYYPDRGITIIVLSNIDSGRDAISVSCDVAATLFGKSTSVLRRIQKTGLLSPAVVGTYAGDRVITNDKPPRYRDQKGNIHQLIVISPREAALADAQDVRLTWSSENGALSASSCGRLLFSAPRRSDDGGRV